MRSYNQYCGLARSLEIVGDRWNLLIVRQLLIAPARYRDLVEGLPGIATNLLADRLRHLEASGVIERRLAGEGSVVEYALTAWGAELRRPIESLIRWSTPLMVRGPGGDSFRPEWLVIALPALLRARVAHTEPVTVGVTVDGETFQISAGPTGVDAGLPDGRELDATIYADGMLLLAMASGMVSLDDIRSDIQIEGDEAAVLKAFG